MGAIVTKKQSNMSWTITWKAAGRYPIVADRIYATLADAQAYVDDTSATASAVPGLVISVVNDPIEKNNGIYYVSKIANTEDTEKSGFPLSATGELVKAGSGAGSMAITNFNIVDGQITEATTDNVGQVIYITAGTEDYPAGPYIVTGFGTVSKLGIISGNGDIASIAADVETLKGTVKNLNEVTIPGISDDVTAHTADITNIKGDLYDQNGLLVLAKSSEVYTINQIDTKLSDYVKTTDYNEFVKSTATNFQSINERIDGLGDTYAAITSVNAIATSVQSLSEEVGNKAAQSDLNDAVGRIETLETAVNKTIPTTYAKQKDLEDLQDEVNALPSYTIVKAESAEEGYASSYKLMAGEVQVGATINVLKDTVVESGEVRKLDEGEVAAGKGDADVDYIVLTIANKTDDKLYIRASSLVDVYKAGSHVTISDDKVVSINLDSLYTAIEDTMVNKKTFATPGAVKDAQDAADAANAAAGNAQATADYAKDQLNNYTTTADLQRDYATKGELGQKEGELKQLIETEDGILDVRLQLVEEQLGLGNTGEGGGPSVSQQLADAIVDVKNLKDTVGNAASTDDEGNPIAATGLHLDVANLSEQISTLGDTAVKKISLNGSELTPVAGTITIDVVNEIKAEGNTDTAIISLGAAKTYVDSKVTTISSSINALETGKASIKLVASDSDATATNVIYLVGDAKAPKVVIDGNLHTLGSALYAPIDKYATATEGGLMAAIDKSKLDQIDAIEISDILAKIEEVNASI